MKPAVTPADDSSTWAPLKVQIFRAFWIASIVSNLGTWIHEVGAGWLMTNLDASPEMVSSVRMAISIPTLLLAIPAGVIADRFDRRKLLIITQCLLLSTTSVLAALTYSERITSWLLLLLTFVIGLGAVMHILTWQATIPTLVPREQMPRAVALGSMSFNLARAVGPAVGGVLIALAGVWIAFAVNAASFAAVLMVLISWQREKTESSNGQDFKQSLAEGLKFVAGDATMRNILLGVFLFLLPATSLWSLLPLVAREQLQWQADGFGFLVTTIGLGAVIAARWLHAVQERLGKDKTITVTMVLFAIGLTMISLAESSMMAIPAAALMGGTWMMTLTTLNAAAQVRLPNSLRARGMGCYMTTLAFSMALGAFIWGQIGGTLGIRPTFWIASALLLAFAGLRQFAKIGS